MAGAIATLPARTHVRRATAESPVAKAILIGITVIFLSLFLLLPLFVVFQEAFASGVHAYLQAFQDRFSQRAITLTLTAAAIAVPLNTIFGLMAAWCLTRFRFPGRSFLISLLDLPLWVSPVIGGLLYVLIFGRQGLIGPWFLDRDIKIIFALPGIVLATIFVTFPFVARGLIPLMLAQGAKEEEAALTLGANGWQIFWRVTVPKIKWGLLYGIILCNARAMGEFGAVSVVSGHIRGKTNTIPLDIQVLYDNYEMVSAFALASVLALLALITLIIKSLAELQTERQLAAAIHSAEIIPQP